MSLTIAEFPKAPDDEIERQVAALEKTLEEARAGNIETVMIVVMTHDGDILQRWSGTEDLMCLLGHLSRAVHIVQKRIDGNVA